jgi:amidase
VISGTSNFTLDRLKILGTPVLHNFHSCHRKVIKGAFEMDPIRSDANHLSEAIQRREISCREVFDAFAARIALRNPALNAVVSLRDPDEVRIEAKRCDDELARGSSRGWMHGFPLAIKDLAETAGLRTTNGSRLLENYVPKSDCLMVERMRACGALVVGKTNVPEFGLGSHTFNDIFGSTKNPYDHTRSAGGSSGGAAVAVATGMVPLADGSDFMGSLRNPAAWNNVFGFRPSQGRVPSWPSSEVFLSQLATEGPIARCVDDLALLLGTQAGFDSRSPLSTRGRLDEFATVESTRRTLAVLDRETRIGWLRDLDGHLAFEPGILDVCSEGLRRLETLGARVEPADLGVSPAELWEAWLVWRRLLVSASLGSLAPDETRRALMKPEALWEIDQGAILTGAQIAAAARVRTTYYRTMLDRFEKFDALALPTTQVWPFDVNLRWPTTIGTRTMDTYHRWMESTIYATFGGLPAISVPTGFSSDGLPMGLQLIGRPGGDVELLRLAKRYESTIEHLRVGEA